ncbi:acyl-CoA dehydrogenase family protein [Agromyces aerolatus]|uniref:acyl-CoA dehydrogenase family protein n=1 Tax=Agromyces sp. LY-1074 TaxID=3074080 RepID=UPI0028637B8F|nr:MULTISPECIES: acyl-CoA dehydrogenase family protein [unclassified Agromyces]MDR5699749.1 acyl-CoA dehydrogenase family protein [Agromyces sp. LY-1074]MDR5706045.1 acyl-CoA dehydrogenase family protein [Agromyces sp. LY-1358]
MKRRLFDAEHQDFRDAFRDFILTEGVPRNEEWERQGYTSPDFWRRAGELGFLGFQAPEEYGGLGIRDFRFNAVIDEEVASCGLATDGFSLHNDIVAPYLTEYATAEQRERWLPGFVNGELITAIAMTEPGAGSDLARIATTAREEDGHFVVSGAKTFITNGHMAGLVLVLARTGDRGMSLLAVERGAPGLTQAAPMHKVGRRAQDTAEVVLDEVRVPVGNLIGERGGAFALVKRNLPQERLAIAVTAVASAERAFAIGRRYATERETFGRPLHQHQTVLHAFAEMHTELQFARSHIDRCILALNDGELSPEEAAAAKYRATDLEGEVIDRIVQLHGGYGFMEETPIARMWRDARVQRIYGGANEIMKEIVGRGVFA